jgi:hypothetical protein
MSIGALNEAIIRNSKVVIDVAFGDLDHLPAFAGSLLAFSRAIWGLSSRRQKSDSGIKTFPLPKAMVGAAQGGARICAVLRPDPEQGSGDGAGVNLSHLSHCSWFAVSRIPMAKTIRATAAITPKVRNVTV